MNKMCHCCVELLQVFTILFPSTGQAFQFGGHQGQPQGQPGGDNQLGRFGGHQHQAVGPHQGHAGQGNQWP